VTPPLCACHGEPMAPNGPRWRCRTKNQARQRAYLLTAKGRARARRFRLREYLSRMDIRLKENS